MTALIERHIIQSCNADLRFVEAKSWSHPRANMPRMFEVQVAIATSPEYLFVSRPWQWVGSRQIKVAYAKKAVAEVEAIANAATNAIGKKCSGQKEAASAIILGDSSS
jgi:hypothetical protein